MCDIKREAKNMFSLYSRNMSIESQAERMETAATEFHRRFHISADEEHASPSTQHQVGF